MDFSAYLKNIIKKRGYSCRRLGSLSGVNHTYISKICRGTSGVPSPEILRKLSGPLCVPYEDLLKEAGYLLAENRPSYSDETGDDILARVARLTAEGKELLSHFIDYLEFWEMQQRNTARKKKK